MLKFWVKLTYLIRANMIVIVNTRKISPESAMLLVDFN